MKKLAITAAILFFTFFVQPERVHAQDDDVEFPEDPGDPDVPFDGGISLLIASAVAYGAKLGHESRAKKIKETVAKD